MFGVEWIAGFEPAQSAWKAEMLAIKHHTHTKKTIIFFRVLVVLIVTRGVP